MAVTNLAELRRRYSPDTPHTFVPRFDLEGRTPEVDDECGICNLLFSTDLHAPVSP